MNKYHKYKGVNRVVGSVNTFKNNLFAQNLLFQQKKRVQNKPKEQTFSQFPQETEQDFNDVLSRAKKLTLINKGKIDKAKKDIKKLQVAESGQFMTGVGLYLQEKQPQEYQIDNDELLKSLRNDDFNDLDELRRMIAKTQSNLRDYSESVYNIQNEVVSAADKYGKDLDPSLALKINKCNLKNTFYNSKPSTANQQSVRRRTMSSHISRRVNK